MVKIVYDVGTVGIPRDELVDAAKTFLLQSGSHKNLVPADNIDSPQFGSSDLLFVSHAKTHLTVARLNDTDDCERFIISSISYYLWLKQLVTVNEALFGAKSRLDMYLFSHHFSASICNLIPRLSTEFKFQLINYSVVLVEGLDEPAVYFQLLTPEKPFQRKPKEKRAPLEEVILKQDQGTPDSLAISAQELSEFVRLKEQHLG
ncbi:MAG: hypothetical protein SWQ30_00740 [Thermodesulfobacteriota bacterium]|nr:hypothetical protein [Thermodesulfobacteriota bacterium]